MSAGRKSVGCRMDRGSAKSPTESRARDWPPAPATCPMVGFAEPQPTLRMPILLAVALAATTQRQCPSESLQMPILLARYRFPCILLGTTEKAARKRGERPQLTGPNPAPATG